MNKIVDPLGHGCLVLRVISTLFITRASPWMHGKKVSWKQNRSALMECPSPFTFIKMGGKQKRAAKYKKWLESQNQILKKACSEGQIPTADGVHHDGSGDHCDYQPIPYHVQQEILRHRAKKGRKSRSTHWILRKLGRVASSFEHWPSWPCTVVITVILTIATFVLLRSLIQLFVPSDAAGVDRSALYNGLRMAVPRPLFKFIRVVDYLFTAPVLRYQELHEIMYPPQEYLR